MVTLLGFFFILANVGLLQLYMPDLIGPVGGIHLRVKAIVLANDRLHKGPSWLYYSFAFGLWM